MKKMIDIVKSVEVRFEECWHKDFMEHAYASLLIVEQDEDYHFTLEGRNFYLPSELDYDIIAEAKERNIDIDEIKEAKDYIKSNYPDVLYMARHNASWIIAEQNNLNLSPQLVDYKYDIYTDEDLENKRETSINKVLDNLDIEFAYDNMRWGSQYDYNEIDITEHLYISVQLYVLDEEDIEKIKTALEKECGCSIEIF